MDTKPPAPKVTYVNLTADNQELNAALDGAFAKVRGGLGATWPLRVGGQALPVRATSESRNPARTEEVVARAAVGTAEDVDAAVAAARGATTAWRRTPWRERCDFLDRAATIVRDRKFELAALLVLEMGKNRVEALGEIEETADLYAWYAQEMRRQDGYVRPMASLAPHDSNTSVLRPYGVWAVIAPWNFPYALLGAPAAAALVAGNTVVLKPSSETPLSGAMINEVFEAAGAPAGVINLVMGGGRTVGDRLAMHPGVDGVTFTGSFDVGFHQLFQKLSTRYPKPCVVEMGGKNPALVMPSADLERAASGIFRSAFGMNGHKCSACSRAYVHADVADDLVRRLTEKAESAVIGDPSDRNTFLGPLATRSSYDDYQRYAAAAREAGRVVTGGAVLRDGAMASGYFARPTVVTNLPRGHALMREELFVPIVCVETVRSLDEALAQANDTDLGLTAGCFSASEAEVNEFLDRIEAGVVYVNRAAGATTGAWPGVQPFGGWKGSGSTGKNIGGHWSLMPYLREQSRTLTR